MLKEAGNIINDTLHNEIGKLRGHDVVITTIILNNSIQNTSPVIWDLFIPVQSQ